MRVTTRLVDLFYYGSVAWKTQTIFSAKRDSGGQGFSIALGAFPCVYWGGS